jgi:hypothetical protein
MIKSLIGGFRPHFLAVCKPDMELVRQALRSQVVGPDNVGFGFQTMYFDRSICRGLDKEINNALISFPSGHTEAAFAGFGFLFLYFNAKFKVFGNYQPRYWKIVVTFAPLLGAVLIAGNLQMYVDASQAFAFRMLTKAQDLQPLLVRYIIWRIDWRSICRGFVPRRIRIGKLSNSSINNLRLSIS